MRTARLACGLVVMLLVSVQPARADLFTIDPNTFAIGTDISTLFPGVTISYLHGNIGPGYNPLRSAATVSRSISADTLSISGSGVNLWNWETCVRNGRSCGDWSVIEMAFAAPTDFVSIDSVWWSDSPTVIAYDSLGNVVDRCETLFGDNGGGCASWSSVGYPEQPNSMTNNVSSAQRNIARVVFGGTVGASSATQVRYSVPEPSTLMFMTAGIMLGLGRLRSKRTKP